MLCDALVNNSYQGRFQVMLKVYDLTTESKKKASDVPFLEDSSFMENAGTATENNSSYDTQKTNSTKRGSFLRKRDSLKSNPKTKDLVNWGNGKLTAKLAQAIAAVSHPYVMST